MGFSRIFYVYLDNPSMVKVLKLWGKTQFLRVLVPTVPPSGAQPFPRFRTLRTRAPPPRPIFPHSHPDPAPNHTDSHLARPRAPRRPRHHRCEFVALRPLATCRHRSPYSSSAPGVATTPLMWRLVGPRTHRTPHRRARARAGNPECPRPVPPPRRCHCQGCLGSGGRRFTPRRASPPPVGPPPADAPWRIFQRACPGSVPPTVCRIVPRGISGPSFQHVPSPASRLCRSLALPRASPRSQHLLPCPRPPWPSRRPGAHFFTPPARQPSQRPARFHTPAPAADAPARGTFRLDRAGWHRPSARFTPTCLPFPIRPTPAPTHLPASTAARPCWRHPPLLRGGTMPRLEIVPTSTPDATAPRHPRRHPPTRRVGPPSCTVPSRRLGPAVARRRPLPRQPQKPRRPRPGRPGRQGRALGPPRRIVSGPHSPHRWAPCPPSPPQPWPSCATLRTGPKHLRSPLTPPSSATTRSPWPVWMKRGS